MISLEWLHGHHAGIVVMVGVLIGLGAVVLIRREARAGVWMWGAWGAMVALALATARFSLHAGHSQMHWAYGAAALRSIPPEDPMFAGRALMYPWIPNLAVGWVSRELDVMPPVVMGVIDAGCLLAMLWGVVGVARLISDRPSVHGLSALLSLTGWMAWSHIEAGWFFAHSHYTIPDIRAIPFDKFFNPNFNPFGLAIGAVGALSIARYAAGTTSAVRCASVMAIVAILAGHLYPLALIGLGVYAAGAWVAVMVGKRGSEQRRWMRSIAPGAGVGLGGLASVPYVLMVSSGKQAAAATTLSGVSWMGWKALALASASAAAAVVCLVAWKIMPREGAENGRAVSAGAARRACLGGAMALGGAYVVVYVPLECEYKFLGMAAVPVACLIAPLLSGLCARSWILGTIAMAVLAGGAADRVVERVRWSMETPAPVRGLAWDGRVKNADRTALFEYLRSKTAPDAVVVSGDLRATTLSRRSLFVAPANLGRTRDGWHLRADALCLRVVGHSDQRYATRRWLADEVLHGTHGQAPIQTAAAIREELDKAGFGRTGRDVYALVSEERVRVLCAATEGGAGAAWEEVMRNGAGAVLKMSKPSP